MADAPDCPAAVAPGRDSGKDEEKVKPAHGVCGIVK